jgi:hypothetical protein
MNMPTAFASFVGVTGLTRAEVAVLEQVVELLRSGQASGYSELWRVLTLAAKQAAMGKGRERHGRAGVPFEQQDIVTIGEALGSNHFELGQALKKARESARLPPARAIVELLGAINYLAAAVLLLERELAAPQAKE